MIVDLGIGGAGRSRQVNCFSLNCMYRTVIFAAFCGYERLAEVQAGDLSICMWISLVISLATVTWFCFHWYMDLGR